MSSINYLTKDSPSLLMIQGDKDTTFRWNTANYMKEKAQAGPRPVEIMIIRNAGHNCVKVDAPIKPPKTRSMQRTVSFLSDPPERDPLGFQHQRNYETHPHAPYRLLLSPLTGLAAVEPAKPTSSSSH